MIQKLQMKLTALCTVITGLILLILTGICLFISESGIRTQEETAFQTNLNTLYQNLEVQPSLSHNWVRQMEYHYQFTIRIFDHGVPLFYQQLEKNKSLEALTEQVVETAFTEYGMDIKNAKALVLSQQKEFTIQDKNRTTYDASAALLACSGGTLGVIVLHPLTQMTRRLFHQRVLFLLADLTALLTLGIFFWYFTARIIRPLEENRRKQAEFVAAASHELRSPLTVILSNVAAVKSGIMPNDRQFLAVIDSEGKRMSRLIGDMLQLASADNHTWTLQPSEVELDTLLLQTWENFESMAAARGIHWEIQLTDTSVPAFWGDEERLRQLLSILIDNAFCYTPKGGRVCLALSLIFKEHMLFHTKKDTQNTFACCHSTKADPASYGYPFKTDHCIFCIQVIDNGPGIPDDQKEAIFERFHRIDSSRKDKSHFGLGLCIAKEIVDLHHGELSVSSTPGGGATFTVMLHSV